MEAYRYISYLMSYIFLMIFALLFVTRRYSMKNSVLICGGTVLSLFLLELVYLEFFPGNNTVYVWITAIQILLTQGVIFFISDTRDSKVVFTGLSASNYVIAGTLAGSITFIYMQSLLLSLLACFLTHLLLLAFLSARIRKIYLSFYEKKNMKSWRELCLVPILFYATFSFIAFFPTPIEENRENIPGVILLIITMFVLYMVVFHYVENETDRNEMRTKSILFEYYIKGLESQCETIEKAENNLRVLRHNMRHYVGMIDSLLDQRNYEEIKKITHHVTEVTDENRVGRYCENIKANTIFSQLMDKAQLLNIEVNYDIMISEDIPVNSLELASVIANLFENAVLCVKELEEEKKTMDILVRCTDRMLIIETKNGYEKEIYFNPVTGLPISRKGEEHGFGLQSVSLFADKINGNFDCYCEKRIFIVRVIAKF